MSHIIYKITSHLGKSYIGYTSQSLDIRFDQHVYGFNTWKNGKTKRGSIKLYQAFEKYGINVFTREILKEFTDREQALAYEIKMISCYDSILNGYNIAAGGKGGQTGSRHSDETKKKMSASRKGKLSSQKGKPLSEEHKAKISASKNKPLINSDGVIFCSFHKAAEFYSVTQQRVSDWVKKNKHGLKRII